jgi:PAS domain S-box-containing protein
VNRLSALIGDACSVLLLSDDRTTLVPAALADRDPAVLAESRELIMEPMTLERHRDMAAVLATGTAFAHAVTDLEELRGRAQPRYFEFVKRIGMHAVMLVPLRVHGDSIGMLSFLRHRASTASYDAQDLAIAQILADHAALAISNARLHAADRAHRKFFENSPLAKFIFDPTTFRVLEVNNAALALYGYTRDEFLSIHIRELRSPEPPGEFEARVAARGRADFVGPSEIRHRSGRLIPVEVWSTVGWFAGREARYVAVTDISARLEATEARASETKFRELTIALAAANQELEAFSYSVAHDLRAPLRGIGGFAQLLGEGYADKLDAEGRDYLDEIKGCAKKMSALIDALLALAKTSRATLEVRAGDLSAIARSTAVQLAVRNADRSVEIAIEDNLRADFDPNLVEALLDNLLANAWKFTSKTPHPRIEVFSIVPGVFCVRDNGAGFDMKYVNKLFAPFQRLHSSTEFPGTGVGLATAQRIVQRHGGRIWAEAEPGKGAAFYFTLQSTAMP